MSELQDLLERYRRGAELLAVATTGAAGPVLDYKESGKWSVRQIVCHLADTEACVAMRVRQVIAEENPMLPGFDGEAWARSLDYDKRKITPMLEVFRVLRASNYELLNSLPEETYARVGNHTERGKMTLLDLLRTYAGHVESHVGQIQRTRAAYKEHKAQQKAAS